MSATQIQLNCLPQLSDKCERENNYTGGKLNKSLKSRSRVPLSVEVQCLVSGLVASFGLPQLLCKFGARSFRFHNVCVLLGKLQPFGYSFQVRIIHFCHWWYGIYVAHVLLPSCGCPWMVERSTLCFPRQVTFLVLVVMLLGFSRG